MSAFIAYVLLPDDHTSPYDVIVRGGTEWLNWQWDESAMKVLSVAEALALRPERGSQFAEAYSTLVDLNGTVFRGYDFSVLISQPPYAIEQFDARGKWNHWAKDPVDPLGGWRCPPWPEFVRDMIVQHVGPVAIVGGFD